MRARRPWSQKYVADKCANCGSTQNLHFHHIVPLGCGGNDIESNIAVLCEMCHNAAHDKGLFNNNGAQFGVRPRKHELTDDVIDALNKWVDCKIGTKECKRRIGMNEGTHIADSTIFKEYREAGYGTNYIPRKNQIDQRKAKYKDNFGDEFQLYY